MVVSLGPTSMSPIRGVPIPKNPRADGTGANPRCLRRDINRNAAMGATSDRAYSLIVNNTDINGFYNQLLGNPPPKNDLYPWGVS
jgi:tyrosinase